MPLKEEPREKEKLDIPRLRMTLEGKFLIATLFIILSSLTPLIVAFFLTVDIIKRESIDLFHREVGATVVIEKAVAAGRSLVSSYRLLEHELEQKNEGIADLFQRTETLEDELHSALDEYADSYTAEGSSSVRDILIRKGRTELLNDETAALSSIKKITKLHEPENATLETLIEAGKFREASELLKNPILPSHETLLADTETLSRITATVVASLGETSDQMIVQLVSSTLIIVIISILLAVGVSTLFVRHLTRPLRNLGQFTEEIGHGNYAAKMPVLTHDEIGTLGATVDHMRKKIQRFITQLQSTYEHEVDHLKEISALKDQFTFIATHELKAPVAAIRWNLDLIKESTAFKKFPADLKQSLTDTEVSILRLNTLVNDLLHVARLEKGTIKPDFQTVDPKTIVEEVIKELGFMSRDRGIRVVYQPAKKIVKLKADPKLLREILQNLVSNAIKYNRVKGEVAVRTGEDDSRAWIEVEDQGIGFTPEEKKNIYKRFWRSERVGDIEGTGLGLYIVKQLTEMMKGEIDLQTKPGAGSTFRVTLPLAKK
ncbi:hypothetical protein A3F28_03310 [Candidatus Uhrbacteria bacterium RIFCSPHIGHO2_12_FULL_57_11]|uniref:histidine kinase n=2 Tax=Candidatus Uhriibacteriota TaxID=1752732 RepID=A0A1F7UG50_9BACT|nr:MAG: hypothetical protein A3D72_00520 [Candidatus Uhrbacteria bacterium RIFCSPHIGHO2_02_FULL_57_19]OGL77233.1 MAG: hypothetical protein A3F28_03310 [Candidatus Uhrbacteria bacterium RIFCSPHIGHO2_12_FULL_57_11]